VVFFFCIAITASNVNVSDEVYGSSNTLNSSSNVKHAQPMNNEQDQNAGGDDHNTPLNGQIYLPFKSMSTLIEEVNTINENIKDSNTNIASMNNPTIKSIKSSESIKYYLDSSRNSDPELSPEEKAMLTKNILTSDTNIGQDIDMKDITKTMDYFCQTGSDVTLNQKTISD